MCRSIKKLRNAEPPTTRDDIRAAARQFVRKVSGFQKPSQKNQDAFEKAVEEIAKTTEGLLGQLEPAQSTKQSAGRPDAAIEGSVVSST
jgi:hypothetical protein